MKKYMKHANKSVLGVDRDFSHCVKSERFNNTQDSR